MADPDPNSPYYVQVCMPQVLMDIDGVMSIEMYAAYVYQGGYSLVSMPGDGDLDIDNIPGNHIPTAGNPGWCKVDCDVTYWIAQAIKADKTNFPTVYIDQPGGR